ncbi:putative metabolite transport protein [Spathaspora sp. JA1]|nr:putative metabolite transport protein [Spathaspora sp. JA1]
MHTPTTIHNFIEIRHSITFKLAWSTFIICLCALQFGYHLAELNAPGDILSCNFHKPGPVPSYNDTIWYKYGFEQCIPMSAQGVAYITTSFTVGGLLASAILGSTSISMDYGRKPLLIISSLFFVLGSLLMILANNSWVMNLGRLFNGIGCGSALIISPILINELTPINHRGLMGAIMQIAVSVGIFFAQLVSYFYSNDQQWRIIFIFSFAIAVLQLVGLFTIPESPKWLILNNADVDQATEILQDLRTEHSTIEYEIDHWKHLTFGPIKERTESSTDEVSPLLQRHNSTVSVCSSVSSRKSLEPPLVTVMDFIFSYKYRHQFIAVILIMTGQQLSGMNAITYYGVKILNTVFNNHNSGSGNRVLVLTCAFSVVNMISSTVVAPLIDRIGRKPLLLASVATCGICSLILAIGIPYKYDVAVITACYGFIIGFAIGLGPIPFLMISELTGHEVVSLAQSLGTVTNWTSNMIIAFSFPLLQNLIGGVVFYIFFIVCAFYFIAFYYKIPETKGIHHVVEVWRDFE